MLFFSLMIFVLVAIIFYTKFIASAQDIHLEQCKRRLVESCNSCKLMKGGEWDSFDSTVSSCGTENTITRGCIAALSCKLNIDWNRFEGAAGVDCRGVPTTIGDSTGRFAPTVCSKVGIN